VIVLDGKGIDVSVDLIVGVEEGSLGVELGSVMRVSIGVAVLVVVGEEMFWREAVMIWVIVLVTLDGETGVSEDSTN
jgi:hypothetical protein